MSLSFKNNLEGMWENDPAGEQALATDYKASENYDTPGHVRNLCFVWPDGRMKFMNYAYLISGELTAEDNIIKLNFSSEVVILYGLNLSKLYLDIFEQTVRKIISIEIRYVEITDKNCSIINEIGLEKS